MTPRETYAVIDAMNWRSEREQKLLLVTAWHTAALSRTKRMPKLHRLLNPPESRALTGKELERRRRERDEALEGLDLDTINEQARKS